MDPIFYLIAVLISIIPIAYKKISFLDILPLLYFYFDATQVFISHKPSYQYFESLIIIIYSIYTINKYNKIYARNFGVFAFLFIAFIAFPILQSETLNQTLRSFSIQYSSLVILPLSFHHYLQKTNLEKLWKSTFVFIIIYVMFTLYATSVQLGGYESERVGGTTFYFGHVAIRGGITYISFVVLLTPLILIQLNKWQRVILIILVGVIFLIFLTVLKRFVFVILGLGVINFIIQPFIKTKYKIMMLVVILSLGYLSIGNNYIQHTIESRINERGETKFTQETIEQDLRIYEPLYIFQDLFNNPGIRIFIGEKGQQIFDIKHEDDQLARKIHNSYARIIISSGIIGIILYLVIFYKLYKFVKIHYRYIIKNISATKYAPVWITFQSLVFIFLLQGMVGGHDHVTLRGLVFLYSGALAGSIVHVSRRSIKDLNKR